MLVDVLLDVFCVSIESCSFHSEAGSIRLRPHRSLLVIGPEQVDLDVIDLQCRIHRSWLAMWFSTLSSRSAQGFASINAVWFCVIGKCAIPMKSPICMCARLKITD